MIKAINTVILFSVLQNYEFFGYRASVFLIYSRFIISLTQTSYVNY